MTITELTRLKKRIEEKNTEKNRLEGKREQLLKSLETLGCSSVNAGKLKIEELSEQSEELRKKIDVQVEKIEAYGLS